MLISYIGGLLAYWPYSPSHGGFCDEATLNPDPPLGIKLICSCSPSRPLRVYSHAKNWEQEGEDRGIRLCIKIENILNNSVDIFTFSVDFDRLFDFF